MYYDDTDYVNVIVSFGFTFFPIRLCSLLLNSSVEKVPKSHTKEKITHTAHE